MSQDVIELNGKRYDALTGAYLGKSHVVPRHLTQQFVKGRVIDGFVRPTHAKRDPPAAAKQTTLPKAEAEPAVHTADKPKTTRNPAGHLKAHRPEHAKTLKQRHTRKPEFSLKPTIKTQAPAEVMAKPASAVVHKRSVYAIDPIRHKRAISTPQHHAIKHFGAPAVHSAPTHVPVIGVRPTPLHLATPRPAQPVKRPDILETAIARATSHQQPEHKVRRRHHGTRRLANTLAIVATFLVIGGFIGYLNLPGIELRVASVQAGFAASLPSYSPTGYALEDGVQQTGGIVSLTFRSGENQYRITQQSSNWNSQTLLDNTLALNGKHETVQKNGQTIYIYENDGTSAAWVNGGIRYDIIGNAQLSKDEVANIAASL